MRENVLEGMVRAPGVVRAQLGECLKAIVNTDYPERWPGLLPALLANLASQARKFPIPWSNPSITASRERRPGLLPALLADLASQARLKPQSAPGNPGNTPPWERQPGPAKRASQLRMRCCQPYMGVP